MSGTPSLAEAWDQGWEAAHLAPWDEKPQNPYLSTPEKVG